MRVIPGLRTLVAVCLIAFLPARAQAEGKGVWVRQPPVFVRKGAPDRTLTEGGFEYRYKAKDQNGQEKEYFNKITFEAPPERMVEGETYSLEIDSTANNPGADISGCWLMDTSSVSEVKGLPGVGSNPYYRAESPHHGEFTFKWLGTPSRALNVPQPEVPVQIYFVAGSNTYESWKIQWNYKLDPKAETPTPDEPLAGARPLDVRIDLSSFSQSAEGLPLVRGDVTVQAPPGVKPGWKVSVSVLCGPDRSALQTVGLLATLGKTRPDQRHSVLAKVPWGGGVRAKTLTLDAQRRAVASLETDFRLPLPGLQAGATTRPCVVLAIATLGNSYYGEAQVGMEVTSVRKGTRFVSLETTPDPAVGGREVTLTLTCEVSGLAPGVRTVPTNAEGRLKWLGAPKDQWIDGRRKGGTTFKVPPMVPLLAQRVPAEALDDEPTRAGVTFTWTVKLPGPGTYAAAFDISPVGFDFLQREVTFEAVQALVAQPPTNPNEGRPEAPQTAEGQQTTTQETPADAPAGATNLALGRPAAQCCVVEGRDAHFAVDGAKSGNVEFRAGRGCGVAGAPYWVIDLGQVAEVTEVRLYNWITNPTDAARARWIEVWFATTPTNGRQVYLRQENDAWGLDGKPLVVNLKRRPPLLRQARWITLRNGGDPPDDINLLEVEVYGRYVGQTPGTTQPPVNDGVRREDGGTGQVSTFGPLKLQIRDGKVVVPDGADLEDGFRLPAGSRLVSIGGVAVVATTTDALNALLKPLRHGVAVMRFELPDGAETIVTVLAD